ncbi:MAG: RelA/SpoT family protein [Patescibacteria group bacterium]
METGIDSFLPDFKSRSPAEQDILLRAYTFAEKAHAGQKRESGDPYFSHLVETARTLAEVGGDTATIAAGLLHDSVEDTGVTLSKIEKEFGAEIAFLVNGVTKLGKLKYRGLKRHVKTLRKLFIATAQDPRVILIKLADRLHNLSTIRALPREKQMRIAVETLEIYAPLAHRLGIGQIKGALEDSAFEIAYPKEYAETRRVLEEKSAETFVHLTHITQALATILKDNDITVHAMDHRVKHLYSLYKKLKQKEMNIEKVYDIAALRIILGSIEDCYLALGLIHAKWRPLPGRIKDYIAVPKVNGYQSLHTTIFTGDGAVVEIQIRTQAMHDHAEFGIASHVSYKEKSTHQEDDLRALRNVLKLPTSGPPLWLHELADHEEGGSNLTFIKNLKGDFFNDRIIVFTPNGEAVDLPLGATPIDFAYAIHTDLGDHAHGARINGKFVALSTKLSQGDIVTIETKENSRPSRKWLEWTKTNTAKKKIRNALENAKN